MTPGFDGFRFLPQTKCAVSKKKFEAKPKVKVGCCCFWAHMYAYNVFFEKMLCFGSFTTI